MYIGGTTCQLRVTVPEMMMGGRSHMLELQLLMCGGSGNCTVSGNVSRDTYKALNITQSKDSILISIIKSRY